VERLVQVRSSGLRERKKERTREQLLDAALRLFTQRGYEETTVDDIVDTVEVSPRTFFRYFQSKEDVLVAWVDEFIDRVRDALATRPPDEEPFTALGKALTEAVAVYDTNRTHFIALERFIARTPAVRARKLEKLGRCSQVMIDVLAKRLDVDARRDLAPRLLANCAIGILGAAVDTWITGGGTGSLAKIVDHAFGCMHPTDALTRSATRPSQRRERLRLPDTNENSRGSTTPPVAKEGNHDTEAHLRRLPHYGAARIMGGTPGPGLSRPRAAGGQRVEGQKRRVSHL
jgi:AcrR family transcriptional regulator